MAGKAKKRKKSATDGPLDAYRRVRKPVPPPARPIEDRRRRVRDEQLRRDLREDLEG